MICYIIVYLFNYCMGACGEQQHAVQARTTPKRPFCIPICGPVQKGKHANHRVQRAAPELQTPVLLRVGCLSPHHRQGELKPLLGKRQPQVVALLSRSLQELQQQLSCTQHRDQRLLQGQPFLSPCFRGTAGWGSYP
jgi:hypothetical protein